MSDKYTPGPWKVERASRQTDFDDTTVCALFYQGKNNGLYISSPAGKHGDEVATAKLIAAAPDLLAAARIAISSLLSREPGYEELKAAIEKATL